MLSLSRFWDPRAAARPGTVMFVHCGVLTVGVRKRLGLNLVSDKSDGERVYRITGGRPSRKA